jgi:hypothetical protein
VEGIVCEKWRGFKEEITTVVIKTARRFWVRCSEIE